MLKYTGAEMRRWREHEESSLELTVQACRDALDGFEEPIDLLISASVFPELVEPATSNLIAYKLGLKTTECMDVKEACDGWIKATKIAQALQDTGAHRNILIACGEFPMTEGFGIYPELFRISSLAEIDSRFPAYTLGEAATAVLLRPERPGEKSNPWHFANITRNDLIGLCTISTPWLNGKTELPKSLSVNGQGLFASYGAELKKHGLPIAVDLYKKEVGPGADILFTHSSSKRDWSEGAKAVGMHNRIVDIYASLGNVVAAAVPAAMAIAKEDGRMELGQKIAAWVVSAGMSFSTASFRY